MQVLQAQNLRKNIAYEDEHVRFTVIADGAVRLEYAPDGQFVDAKSFVAVEREYPAAEYKVKKGAWIEISTPKMILRYKRNSGAFPLRISRYALRRILLHPLHGSPE